MKLRINKLGPIHKPSVIDLNKRFTVFTGENGSGKTYLSTALWELLQRSSLDRHKDFDNGKGESKDNPKRINTIAEAIVNEILSSEGNRIDTSKYFDDINKIVASYIQSFMFQSVKDAQIEYNGSLSLKSYFKKWSKVGRWAGMYSIKWDRNDNGVITFLDAVGLGRLEKEQAEELKEISKILIRGVVLRMIHDYPIFLKRELMFLPTSRINLLSLWKYITTHERQEKNEILERINTSGNLNSDEVAYYQSDYSLPSAHIIKLLEEFENDDHESNPYPDLVEELEDIMGGAIVYRRLLEGFGRKRYYYKMKNAEEELPLYQAASSVNQLAVFYVYLKYFSNKTGNTLFIDEPEMNLHPENQVKLANLLVKFANRGNNCVYIATHSPFITETINNHILVGYLQEQGEAGVQWLEKHLPEHDLEINPNLSYKDFGVYHFGDGGFEEYEIGEYGISIKDFDETKEDIHDATRDILNGIWMQQQQAK